MDAEYAALSTAIRDLTPFIDQVEELSDIFGQSNRKVHMHCTNFEDKIKLLELGTTPRYYPRTKHIVIKYYHFRGCV